MKRLTHPVGRYFGILAVCIFALLSFSSIVQAQFTQTDANQFEITRATASTTRWTTEDCEDEDDINDGCYVEVRADSTLQTQIGAPTGSETFADKWAAFFNENCTRVRDGDDYDEQNEEFNDCWEGEGATVTWPQVNPREYFEATGFCKSGDSSCSIRLNICYNSNECDGSSRNDDEFDIDDGEIAYFFEEAKSCLFDVKDSKLTECINDELKDVYDDLQRKGTFGFGDLEEELEELGVEIERYSDSLTKVEDKSYFGREYVTGIDKRESYYAPPSRTVGAYQSSTVKTTKPWTNIGFWPTISGSSRGLAGDFILVNFTQHLEAQPYTNICGTSKGCINLVGRSSHFSSMGNISIVIRDARTISCMRNRGYGIGRGTILAFNDPNLQVCDRRMAAANSSCPDCGEGAKAELLKMYNLGLLSDVLTPAMAQGMQRDLSEATSNAPRCLCNAGFISGDLLLSSTSSDNPWEAGASAYFSNICG